MKLISFLLIFLFSGASFAKATSCRAEKSLSFFNPKSGQVETRRASTPSFPVATAPNDEAKVLEFTDDSGRPWGSVEVSTGSHLSENWFFASATVVDSGGALLAFLRLKLPLGSAHAETSTMIMDSTQETPPSLLLVCSVE